MEETTPEPPGPDVEVIMRKLLGLFQIFFVQCDKRQFNEK
jgi:hypothetical protein